MRTRFLAIALMLLLPAVFLHAQEDQEDQIRLRIDETTEMISEEESSIKLLEDQLKSALEDNDTDEADRLRTEINDSYDRLDKLRDILKDLNGLQEEAKDDVAGDGDARGPRRPGGFRRGRPVVPNPQIGGMDGGDMERERRRYERDRRERERNRGPQIALGGAPGAAGGGGAVRREPRRLRNLRDAFDALMDAGEHELAEDVQDLIEKEERQLNRDRDCDDDDGAGRARGGQGGPVRADDDDRGARRPPARDRNRDRDNRGNDDMQDEIDRLRDKLKELEERSRGDDG